MKISWIVVTNLVPLTLGRGWVCEFLRHQSFPSRWRHWAPCPTRTLHDIISPTLGDSKTATLHRVVGQHHSLALTRVSAAPLWPPQLRSDCRFQTNAFMPHFTFFARMFKNVGRDNNWNKRIMFVPSPRRKPAQQSSFLEYLINKSFYSFLLLHCTNALFVSIISQRRYFDIF